MVTKSILEDWLIELRPAESVALTGCVALRGMDTTDSMALEETLRLGCANVLLRVIQAMENVSARGDENEEAEGQLA